MLDQIKIDYYSIPESSSAQLKNADANTIVVCRDSDLNSDSQEMLKKMLSAVKLSDSAIEILRLKQDQLYPLHQCFSLNRQMTCLVFGFAPKDVGMNINASKYSPISFRDHKIVFSDSLTQLINQPALKKPLWQSLQHIYLKK